MMKTSEMLPIEQAFPDMLNIYAKRFAKLIIYVLAGFVVFGAILFFREIEIKPVNIPADTSVMLLAGLMGVLGGLITIPINALFTWYLKREEMMYQHKLDLVAKKRELLLQHHLEMNRIQNTTKDNDLGKRQIEITDDLNELKLTINRLKKNLNIQLEETEAGKKALALSDDDTLLSEFIAAMAIEKYTLLEDGAENVT